MPDRVRALGGTRPRKIVVWRGSLRVTFWYRGKWRGIGLPTWERFDLTGPIPVLLSKGGGGMPNKPSGEDGASLPLTGAAYGQWGKGFPNLSSWLCDALYTDRTPMGQVTLTLKREGTAVRAILKVEDHAGIKCSAVGPDPLSALAALELLLAAPKVPWEKDPYPLGQKGQGKRK